MEVVFSVQIPPVLFALAAMFVIPKTIGLCLCDWHRYYLTNLESAWDRIDFIGSALLRVTLVTFIVAVDFGRRGVYSWNNWCVVGLFVVGIVFGTLFSYVVEYVAKEPVVPLEIFRNQSAIFSTVSSTLLAMVGWGALYYVPVFLIAIQFYTIDQAGGKIMVNFLTSCLRSFVCGIHIKKTGRY